MHTLRLNNKTIVITGGTKGIGRSLITECLNQGANVIFGGRDKIAGENILNIHRENSKNLVFLESDLKNISDCKKLFDTAEDKFGTVDGFVNYAGITPKASLTDCNEETYDEVMDINIKSAFFCVQQAIKCMQKVGGGSIVLVGSAHSWSGQKDRAPYAISKGALFTMFEHISHNYADEKIRCNFITMGWTPTDGEIALRAKEGMSKEQLLELGASILPMGRMLTPEDHLPAFIYLLSDESSMVTGSNIRVTAGEYI
jgi:NAD(P)-dependent dehydrogenase (short-subunit alcohol dehydrogenase family)